MISGDSGYLPKITRFLGNSIGKNGVQPTKTGIKALIFFIKPRMLKVLKRFLVLGSFKTKYIPKFAEYERTLKIGITKDKTVTWTKKCDEASDSIKKPIANSNEVAKLKKEPITFILYDISGKCLSATQCRSMVRKTEQSVIPKIS
jgi:hypothetical protein